MSSDTSSTTSSRAVGPVAGNSTGGARGAKAPRRPAGARWRRRRGSRDGLIAIAFLAPAVAVLIVLRIVPAISAVGESLRQTSLLTQTTRWSGLENYRELFADPLFWQTVRTTLLFAVIVNPVQILLALGLAVLLNQRLPGEGVWRALIFVPAAAPAAVSAIIWGVIYQPEGALNALLGAFGVAPAAFLTSPRQALLAMIVLLSWIGVGYWMVFLIAGLQDIPDIYYDAAAVDGAGWWRTFFNVTLPLLRRPLAFVLVADTVGNFLVFAPIQILTNGGPQGATNLIMYDIYNKAYQNGDVNTAGAEVTLLIVLMLIIVTVQFRLLRSKEER
jgi:multiple sugar transport system permease protein